MVCPTLPFEAKLFAALRTNDSTLMKIPKNDLMFSSINYSTQYLFYAPKLSKNKLQQYFTRLRRVSNTEICVSLCHATIVGKFFYILRKNFSFLKGLSLFLIPIQIGNLKQWFTIRLGRRCYFRKIVLAYILLKLRQGLTFRVLSKQRVFLCKGLLNHKVHFFSQVCSLHLY